jgi:Flp pilus assembly pilin Flp
MSAGTPNFSDRSADVVQPAIVPGFSHAVRRAARRPRGADHDRTVGPPPARSPKEFPMLRFCVFLHGFLTQPLRRDDRGVTSVEYGLMVALISIAIAATVAGLAGALNGTFTNITGRLAP